MEIRWRHSVPMSQRCLNFQKVNFLCTSSEKPIYTWCGFFPDRVSMALLSSLKMSTFLFSATFQTLSRADLQTFITKASPTFQENWNNSQLVILQLTINRLLPLHHSLLLRHSWFDIDLVDLASVSLYGSQTRRHTIQEFSSTSNFNSLHKILKSISRLD